MTKLLYIPTGEYVEFVSSFSYDKIHNLTAGQILIKVVEFEDSFSFEECPEMTIEGHIAEYLLTGSEPINDEVPRNSGMIITREEFEIIYD